MTARDRAGRAAVYLQALATAAAYAGAVAVVDLVYVRRHIPDRGLAFGYAFCLTEGGVIGGLLLLSLVLKAVRHRRDRTWERLHPRITAEAVAYLAGGDSAVLRTLVRRHPREVERCICEMLLFVQGTARARVSALACELRLDRVWKRRYRSWRDDARREAISRLGQLEGGAANEVLLLALADPNDEVKLEASRALLRGGGRDEITAVFRAALKESLLVRAVLTEALRPHTLMLCGSAVPGALACGDARTARTALEIVRGWGKSVPLASLDTLLGHSDAGVRAAALLVVPQMLNPAGCAPLIVAALGDPDEAVRTAAATVAGKLRLESAFAALVKCLRGGGADITVAAAYALAALGPEGCRVLEREVLVSRSASACAALEALERARSERVHLVPA
ncbi:MAG: HEAT repeat domain-containing protein [Acidobacteria bacterium]|nr:HEAT repeat domain-containing protein [Acidobacteriota bacterium]